MKYFVTFACGVVLGGLAIWHLAGAGSATTDTIRLTYAGSQATTLSTYRRILNANEQDVKCLVSRLSEATAATLRETSLEATSHVTVGIRQFNSSLVGDALSEYDASDIGRHARSCQMTAAVSPEAARG